MKSKNEIISIIPKRYLFILYVFLSKKYIFKTCEWIKEFYEYYVDSGGNLTISTSLELTLLLFILIIDFLD